MAASEFITAKECQSSHDKLVDRFDREYGEPLQALQVHRASTNEKLANGQKRMDEMRADIAVIKRAQEPKKPNYLAWAGFALVVLTTLTGVVLYIGTKTDRHEVKTMIQDRKPDPEMQQSVKAMEAKMVDFHVEQRVMQTEVADIKEDVKKVGAGVEDIKVLLQRRARRQDP